MLVGLANFLVAELLFLLCWHWWPVCCCKREEEDEEPLRVFQIKNAIDPIIGFIDHERKAQIKEAIIGVTLAATVSIVGKWSFIADMDSKADKAIKDSIMFANVDVYRVSILRFLAYVDTVMIFVNFVAFTSELLFKQKLSRSINILTHVFELKKLAYIGCIVNFVNNITSGVIGAMVFQNHDFETTFGFILMIVDVVGAAHVDILELLKVYNMDAVEVDEMLRDTIEMYRQLNKDLNQQKRDNEELREDNSQKNEDLLRLRKEIVRQRRSNLQQRRPSGVDQRNKASKQNTILKLH